MTTQTPDMTKLVAETQKQAIAAIAQAHEAMLKTAEIAMGSIPTESPSFWSAPAAKEILGSSYDFVGKVLAEQKSFALRLTGLVSECANEGRKSVAEAIAQK